MLNDLIEETKIEYRDTDSTSWANSLLNVLRKNHYWPAIQTKKFNGNQSMVLLHNTYRRKDINEYQDLYNECRSVVLDFESENIIINKASPVPIRLSTKDYVNTKSSEDKCELAYDTTMIFVYYNNSTWHFGTTSCPSIDYSKFSHPTKKYGVMFNEILTTLLNNNNNNNDIRDSFCELLNPEYIYEFGMIHHDNTKYMDYTDIFGKEYKKLILLNLKEKISGKRVYDDENLVKLGVLKPKKFETPDEAIKEINTQGSAIYGIIVNRNEVLYKVSTNSIIFHEETDPGNPNPWRNMLWIYQQNRDDFHINDYIKTYAHTVEYPLDNSGTPLDPTYLIHTAISTIKDILHNLYTTTTTYFPKHNRFKMSKDIDKKLPPILQYHLAQLRHQQVTTYKDTKNIITANAVFQYLCHSNPVKNLVSLIHFFAINTGYDIPPRASLCFSVLNNLLTV